MDDDIRVIVTHIIDMLTRFLFTLVAAMLICENHLVFGTIILLYGWVLPSLRQGED